MKVRDISTNATHELFNLFNATNGAQDKETQLLNRVAYSAFFMMQQTVEMLDSGRVDEAIVALADKYVADAKDERPEVANVPIEVIRNCITNGSAIYQVTVGRFGWERTTALVFQAAHSTYSIAYDLERRELLESYTALI